MASDVQHLSELQQFDREILRLRDEIAAFPKRIAQIEQRLAGTKAHLESAKAAIKGDEAARRKFETAIQDLQQKISKYRDQSLEVKTDDQYKALMHEIQFAEQDIRANEDKILDLMVNAEAREKDVKAAEAKLKAEMAEIEKEKTEARQRTAEDEKQLAEWNAKRDEARAGVSDDLLRHYDRVLKFRGSGLAEVRDQKCMGCQVMLRPQTYNEVRGGQLVFCESCQRILYFDPASEIAVERPSRNAKEAELGPKPTLIARGFTVLISPILEKFSWPSSTPREAPAGGFTTHTQAEKSATRNMKPAILARPLPAISRPASFLAAESGTSSNWKNGIPNYR